MGMGIDFSRSRFHRFTGPYFKRLPALSGEALLCAPHYQLPELFQRAKEARRMKKLTGSAICLIFSGLVAGAGAGVAAAQDTMGPPPVLVIQREFLKPGKAGIAHEKSESQFVQAFTAAKWPTYYLAMTSLSGRSRALFITGYPTFEAWGKDTHAMAMNPTLSAALERVQVADGELQTEFEQSVYTYNADMSLHIGSVVHARYFSIMQFKVKEGHHAEWMELVKMYKDAFAKIPNANWAMYESHFGQDNGGLYLFFTKMTSLSEEDQAMGDSKKFMEIMGEKGMTKIEGLSASCIEWDQTNLFEFSPKMSYPDPDWIKADSFWKAKAAAPAKAATP
jgi:hypothetical protein